MSPQGYIYFDRFSQPQSSFGGSNYTLRLLSATLHSTIEESLPEAIELLSPYPNPAHEYVSVEFRLAVQGNVTMTMHDILGRTVATLADGSRMAGRYTMRFNTSKLTPGLYFLRAISGAEVRTQKVMVR